MNIKELRRELLKMEEAESRLLDILTISLGATEQEIKLATSTLFDIAEYIVDLKYYIKKLEGDEDE